MDQFQQLLWDLGEIVEIPFHVDKNHSCNLLLDESLEVQMQMDEHGEHLILCAFVSEVPPGRFRENVLKDALRVNSSFHPFGVFAFQEKKNLLLLQKLLPIEHLSGEKLLKELEEFIEEADEWRLALESGASSPRKYNTVEGSPPPFIR